MSDTLKLKVEGALAFGEKMDHEGNFGFPSTHINMGNKKATAQTSSMVEEVVPTEAKPADESHESLHEEPKPVDNSFTVAHE